MSRKRPLDWVSMVKAVGQTVKGARSALVIQACSPQRNLLSPLPRHKAWDKEFPTSSPLNMRGNILHLMGTVRSILISSNLCSVII